MAALIMAMRDGIDRKLDPGPPQQRNIYEAMEAGKQVKKVPMTFGDALDALEADEVVEVRAARRAVPTSSSTTSATSGSATARRSPTGSARVPRRPAVKG